MTAILNRPDPTGGGAVTAVATPAVSRQRLLADVRDLAELVSEAMSRDDLLFLLVDVSAAVATEKEHAGTVRTPALKALGAAVIHLKRGGLEESLATARRLAAECLTDAARALEATP